jgi:hypothetical protein
MRETSCPWECIGGHLDHRHRCRLAALFLIDLALCKRTVTGVSCGCAIFGTGELVPPILCAGFSSQEAADRAYLVLDIRLG